MNRTELQKMLIRHRYWMDDPEVGERFDSANLDDLSALTIRKNSLDQAVLDRARIALDLTKVSMRAASLRGADITRTDFTGAIINRARFAGAYTTNTHVDGRVCFKDAYAEEADFSETKLRCADFRRADLYGAKFFKADLTGASFEEALLGHADFRYADITHVSFFRTPVGAARGLIDAGVQNGYRIVGWVRDESLTRTLMVRAGCRTMSIREGRSYWRGKLDREEVLAALDLIEAVAKSRSKTDPYWNVQS